MPWGTRGILLVAVLIAGGITLAIWAPRCGLEANAEGEILSCLKSTERSGLSLPVPGARIPLVSRTHHYDRISVQVDYPKGTAVAVATLDFTGKLGDTEVSSLGLERVNFRYRAGNWEPSGGLAPLLVQAVSRLEARRLALTTGSAGRLASLFAGGAGLPTDPHLQRLLSMTSRDYQVKAWYLRSEREGIQASEAYRLTGDAPDRPVDEEGLRSLSLIRRGQELFFWPSLM